MCMKIYGIPDDADSETEDNNNEERDKWYFALVGKERSHGFCFGKEEAVDRIDNYH